MAPQKVLPTADGRPVARVLPAAKPETSRLTNPKLSATVAAPEVPQAEGQGAWAWASDELKRKLRAVFRDEARSGEASPARKFGAGFGFGAIGLGEALGLSPNQKMEKFEATQDNLSHRVQILEASRAPQAKPKRPRRGQKFGGRGVKKNYDYWLDRWERDVARELKDEGCPAKEREEKMCERVYGLGSASAAKEINARYRAENGGKDVLSGSSLRRRHSPLTTTGSRGETASVKGAFICKRWGDWEVYRKEEQADDRLAPGSTKMPLPDDDDARSAPAADRSAATVAGKLATNKDEDEDDRKRSLFDRSLETATVAELAEQAIEDGKLTKHEGGRGVTHVRPPENDLEALEDQQEQEANALLRQNGLDPDAVHHGQKCRRKGGRKTTKTAD